MSLHRTYKEAAIVEKIIEARLSEEDPIVYSYPWLNGREKGFCFTTLTAPCVFVAEHRNSDDLTITIGKYSEWDFITDEEYKKREFFPYKSYNGVADRVLEILGVGNEVS